MTHSTPSTPSLSIPLATTHLTSSLQVDELIENKLIVRILQPKLLEELSERLANGRFSHEVAPNGWERRPLTIPAWPCQRADPPSGPGADPLAAR